MTSVRRFQVPTLLGYDAVLVDNLFPMFQHNVVVSFPMQYFLDISTLEDETTTLSRNVGNQLPSDTASNRRRKDISSTPLRKPKNSQVRTGFGDLQVNMFCMES